MSPINIVITLLGIASLAGVHGSEKAWTEFRGREALVELGTAAFNHTSTPCDPNVVGSAAACFNQSIASAGVLDYPLNDTKVAVPTDVNTPYGIHITPYGTNAYLFSWLTGHAMMGPNLIAPLTSTMTAMVMLSLSRDGDTMNFEGKVVNYVRNYTGATISNNYSYCSPFISHVLVDGLKADKKYYYSIGATMAADTQTMGNFMTFPRAAKAYPIRIGLTGDVGQTRNSSDTLDHLLASKPDVVFDTGDLSYSDNYGPVDKMGAGGTYQNRWESYSVMWNKVFKNIPVVHCAGNHEIEQVGINAAINYTTANFSYPTNYPFQSYGARFPPSGTPMEKVGSIDAALYWSNTVAGVIRVISLNNYIPFQVGSPQHTWFLAELKALDRKTTPWLIVMFHVGLYHTYYTHYKEAVCFMDTYEPLFYEYGVDFVLHGHVHAYERTHPVYKYKQDVCAPVYITIGDGGNIEGPYRNFVDEINPNTNKTYCEGLAYSGLKPNQMWPNNRTLWGPGYQRQCHAPGCNTLTWEPASGVTSGPGLVQLNNSGTDGTDPLYFCQSSQPKWSAHRDPSFGHGILELKSRNVAHLSWYRNQDGIAEKRDFAILQRTDRGSCKKVMQN